MGPLITVPADGNGLIAGFPDTSGTLPGLFCDRCLRHCRDEPAGPGTGRPVAGGHLDRHRALHRREELRGVPRGGRARIEGHRAVAW